MFISSPKKFRRCINDDFTGFGLPKYVIYYRPTYYVHWTFCVESLVLWLLRSDAGMAAW